jgi:hypothetical protein
MTEQQAFSQQQQFPTITIDGKERLVSDLPQDLQNIISIYATWEQKLADAKLQVFFVEAAMRGLTAEIEARIKQVDSTPKL